MRSLRLAAAAVACLSTVALLSACDPDGTGGGDTAASAPAASAPSTPSVPGSSGTAKSPAAGEGTPGKAGRLPAGVWIDPKAVPLNAALHWKAPGSAVKVLGEQGAFRIETLCLIPRDDSFTQLPMAETASLGGAAGDWAADQIVASFGSSQNYSGRAQSAHAVFTTLKEGVKNCATTVPGTVVKIDSEGGTTLAATLSIPLTGGGTAEVHEYLSTPDGSVAELTLHAQLPAGARPRTAWSAPAATGVLDALGKPLCTAFADC
ncbi:MULTISPECIES: hypothetical protein [Kitasatospora]|uniref:Lipoprotein n=1 Tax=Kitasatospora setae (strain ATCC 33774 / DSM 43861 / JCM 3304 / KCC A-0304 / NBRC 14216 / KM-6054) TaxID=452652 RepID=E4N748_KITSK|nr:MULTISPECIES: hypothetical protein [Kitasatospora]BAJ27029.1 hypothetical protein KSE_11960 [Kitasatospora setae KM-6054]